MTIHSFTRSISAGVTHFWRNVWLSIAATAVMMLTLVMLAVLLIVTVLGQEVLVSIENKVDMTLFMSDTADEAGILLIKADLEARQDVKSVQYVSKDQALASFQKRHEDNPLIQQALTELGDNPLQPNLIVRAKKPELYAQINETLKSPKYQPFIGRVSYDDNKDVIANLTLFIRTTRRIGLGLTAMFGIIAVLVTFNTIRLAIYGYHEEIEIMHLVGASPWFIKGPFLIEGILAGTIASLLTLTVLYPLLYLLAPRLSAYFVDGQFNLFHWATEPLHAVVVVGVVASAGIILGMVSSIIAVQRYLQD